MISVRRQGASIGIRLHHMFLDGDDSVLMSLKDLICGRKRAAKGRLGAFIERHRDRIREATCSGRQKAPRVRTQGEFFDLGAAFQRLNRDYFHESVNCIVTWGYGRKSARQRSVRLGSYSEKTKTIRIHPLLDRAFVPFYVLEAVLYHEMLHHLLGMHQIHGRRVSHHRAFRAMEERFVYQERACRWIKDHLSRLLRPH